MNRFTTPQDTTQHDTAAAGSPTPTDTPSTWCGDATSVITFLQPLRMALDAPGVLEVCVNRPGELLVETQHGWQAVAAPAMTYDRCLWHSPPR